MTWILSNGDSTREFPTKEEAQDAKAELAGLGANLSIEEKETENTGSDGSEELEADYIRMPNDEPESEVSENWGNDDNGGCPACGKHPDCLYRCKHCGHDLAGIRTGVGTGGGRP